MTKKQFNWPEKKIALQDLFLDPENYRLKIERETHLENQKDIIDNLIRNDDILPLAKRISKHGFVPVEKMIALKQKGKYIILEGNRRLAALKCLINPNLAKRPNLIRSFKEIGRSLPLSNIKEISVFVAPNREEALRTFIIPKHTEPSIKKWSTYNQSKLYAKAVLNQSKTIDQVCSNYDTTKEKVLAALRMYQCYEIATKIPLSEEAMQKVLDEREFRITTLDRLIQTEIGQKFLGIRFDEKGFLKGKIKKEEFIKGYSKIVSDVALEKQTSRSLNKKESIKQYLENFKHNKPDLSKRGTFSVNSFNKSKTTSKSKRTKPNSKLIKNTLKDYNFIISDRSAIILKVYEEIKVIDFYKKPYTFSMVFRAFLHMCCLQYAREYSLFDKIRKSERKAQINKKDPTLGECLTYFKKKDIFTDRGINSSIEAFMNSQSNSKMTTLETLNRVNHANTTTISGERHEEMLSTLEQFIRKLLRENNANS